MARADGSGGERFVAGAAVAVVHVMLAWLLIRAGAVALPVEDPPTPLQVTWIDPPVMVPPRAARIGTPIEPAAPQAVPPALQRPSQRDAVASPAPPDDADAAPAADVPMSATFIEQARALARDSAAAPIAAADPFANRGASLPAPDRGRFRMRAPVTPKTVVESIGRLFGGGPSDPCPRLRDNIADLATGGDSAALREATDRRQSHCP